jgi:hypothetical protein
MPPHSRSLPIIRVVQHDLAWRVVHDPLVVRLVDTLCSCERALEHALELAHELIRHGERAILVRVERAGTILEECLVT